MRVSLINLLLVSALGCLMRYKIAFSFPLVDQKFLLHAHSHFAFSGWVNQLLMSLMIFHLHRFSLQNACSKYRYYLFANLITAYGMLISFMLQGYGPVSITFSTLSIFVSYAFSARFLKDTKNMKHTGVANKWFLAALLFNILSSAGPFHLAYMMATKTLTETAYLRSIYFFLHFQYNGWFLFACVGLLLSWMKTKGICLKNDKLIFYLHFISCFPAYLLSVLWMPSIIQLMPLIILASAMQMAGFALLYIRIKQTKIFRSLKKNAGSVLVQLATLAYAIKLLLQTASTYPTLSNLAFGFRPIVIGYLHLVLLGVISLFLLGYLMLQKLITFNKLTKLSLIIFVSGIVINEFLLMLQGAAGIAYISIPGINEMLLGAALTLFCGLLLLLLSQRKKEQTLLPHKPKKRSEAVFS